MIARVKSFFRVGYGQRVNLRVRVKHCCFGVLAYLQVLFLGLSSAVSAWMIISLAGSCESTNVWNQPHSIIPNLNVRSATARIFRELERTLG